MFSPFDISCDRPSWNWILWDKITAHIKSREWQLLFVLTAFLPSPCSYCFLTYFHVKDCRMNSMIYFFLRKVAYDSILCGFYLQLNCIIISWSFAPTILLISLMKNTILSYCHEAYQSKFLDQMRTPNSLMSNEIALPLMSLKVLDYEQTDWHELSHSYCLSQSMMFHGLTFNLYIVVVSYVNHCRCESNASFKMDM